MPVRIFTTRVVKIAVAVPDRLPRMKTEGPATWGVEALRCTNLQSRVLIRELPKVSPAIAIGAASLEPGI
jgi:hypothetical protein